MKSILSFRVILPAATCAAIAAAPLYALAQGGQGVYPNTGYYPAPEAYAQSYYYPQNAYGQAMGGYDPSAYAYPAQSGYAYPPQSGYAYAQPGYDTSYLQQPYGAYSYADPNAYYGYAQQPGYGYAAPGYYPGYGSSPGAGPFSGANVPWNNWNKPDIFGEKSPFQDPLQNEGYWTKKGFRPWRSGPFAYDKWEDHPGTQLPWGNFPGWGDGFFGGFGPDSWEGATPWGNDVPFKWTDPTDPEESFAEIWEDALNTPSKMGRMPPGWTAPYISVPNPIDVENEFERNAMNAPDEISKMWSDGGGGFGGAPSDSGTQSDKQDKPQDKSSQARPGQPPGNEARAPGPKPGN